MKTYNIDGEEYFKAKDIRLFITIHTNFIKARMETCCSETRWEEVNELLNEMKAATQNSS